MTNDIGQVRFGESDATKKRLCAVSNTNKFRQKTGCTYYKQIIRLIVSSVKKTFKLPNCQYIGVNIFLCRFNFRFGNMDLDAAECTLFPFIYGMSYV